MLNQKYVKIIRCVSASAVPHEFCHTYRVQDSQNEVPSIINLNPDLHVLIVSFAACVTAPRRIPLLRLLLLRNRHLCAGHHGVET